MTASRHKAAMPLAFSARLWSRRVCRLAATLMVGTALALPAAAWQETEQPVPEGNQETKPAEQATDRYFLGPKPQLQRQVGPAIGKPRSITPQPYLPKGSITVPAPEMTEAPSEGDTLAPVPDALLDDGIPDPSAQAGGQDAPDGSILEGTLDVIDPSGVAVLRGDDAFPSDFWAGYDRQAIMAELARLSAPSRSPAMVGIARKAALSGFTLAAPESDTSADSFIAARLRLLAAHGDRDGYLALLARLPSDHDWSGLARQITDGHLLAGRTEDACAIAATERADSNDPFWLRIASFCRAVRGDRVGVDFQLGILEEVSSIQPTFYQLTDQILVEAEQQNSTLLKSGLPLTNALRVDVLEATMARLARAQVAMLDLEGANPLAARAMLSIPGVADAAKLQLIGLGLEQGWLTSDILEAYVASAPAGAAISADLFTLAETDPDFAVDVKLLRLLAQSPDAAERMQAVTLLKSRAQQFGRAAYVLPVIAGILRDDASSADRTGASLRAAFLKGDETSAQAAYTALRAGRAGDDASTDRMLAASWPLSVVSGMQGSTAVSADRIAAWWQTEGEREDRFARATLLFSVLEALGETIPESAWALAEGAPVQAEGAVISAAHWRRFLMTAAAGDKAGALVQAYGLTAEGKTSAAFAGSLVGTLKDLGLEAEARRLATEILIANGL